MVTSRKKILHILGSHEIDSVTTSAKILNKYLLTKNYDSKLCYFTNEESNFNINSFDRTFFFRKFKSFFFSRIINFLKKDKSFAFFSNAGFGNLKKIISRFNPDILHFHWMPRAIDLKELINLNIKIVWTIRDFWPFTGGCNYPVFCNKYMDYCYNCQHLKFNIIKDLSYYNFKNKKNIYKKLKNIYLTFPCLDFIDVYKKSILNNIKNYQVIPNSFDETNFCLKDKLKNDNIKICFGAQNLDQEWKGTDIIINIIKHYKKNCEFYIFGKTVKYRNFFKQNKKVRFFGYLNPKELNQIFNESTILVFPSLYESFGKIILESLSCGTPVVAKNSFGAKDIINHMKNGFLVNSNNYQDYILGIDKLLSIHDQNLINECINSSKNYSIEIVGKQFENLYKKII